MRASVDWRASGLVIAVSALVLGAACSSLNGPMEYSENALRYPATMLEVYRLAEIMALEWDDVDLKRRPAHVVVRRSEWRGHATEPKGGRSHGPAASAVCSARCTFS